jgi:hypothetical protein
MPAFSRRAARDGRPTIPTQYFQQDPSTPAKAGVHGAAREFYQVLHCPPAAAAWIPAFAGMEEETEFGDR